MTDWTRRTVLRALGAGAAAPLWSGCGGAPVPPTARGSAPQGLEAIDASTLRERLRAAVGQLGGYAHAGAFATYGQQLRARADAVELRVDAAPLALAVLTVEDERGLRHERATTDLSAAGIARAAAPLIDRARGTRPLGPAASAPPRHAPSVEAGPWARERLARALRFGDSRIVYREAWAVRSHQDALWVGDGGDRWELRTRSRAGAGFVAASGDGAFAEGCERAAAGDLHDVELDDDALAAAAAGALSLLTARRAEANTLDLLWSAPVAVAALRDAIAPALVGERWVAGDAPLLWSGASIAAAGVTITDDPRAEGAFGRCEFDDEGIAAEPRAVVERGIVKGPLATRASATALGVAAGSARRSRDDGRARAAPSHLRLEPGEATLEALIARVGHGVLVEGPLATAVALPAWTATLRCARAREIRDGRPTGRTFGPVVLAGRVDDWLRAVRGATRATASLARDDGSSFESPALLTHGRVYAAP